MSSTREFDEAEPFLDEGSHQSGSSHYSCSCRQTNRTRNLIQIFPWVMSAVLWIITASTLLSKQEQQSCDIILSNNMSNQSNNTPMASNSFFATDFESLQSYVEYETRTFTGALDWNETSQIFYRHIDAEVPQYVGPPNKAIDAAWEAIFDKEWTYMLDDEAAPFLPELRPFNGAYLFEPDMYHSLHCLNEVRKHIDADYYTNTAGEGSYPVSQSDWNRIHIDHCLDQLRQSILCFGDLSPVPLYTWDGAPLGIGKGTAHTCRKWDPIRDWVDQRHPRQEDEDEADADDDDVIDES